MNRTLVNFEQRRQEIVYQIAQLGDLRAGSVTSTSGRCGKPSCRCHQAGQPAHGPNFRLTYKVAGKSVSESLPTPAAIHKAEREVGRVPQIPATQSLSLSRRTPRSAACGRARGWARPTRKKNGGSDPPGNRARSRRNCLRVIFNGRRKTGALDLEAIEMAVRSAMHQAGAAALTELLQFPDTAGGSAQRGLCLRPSGALPGIAFQAGSHRRGPGASVAALLFVPALSRGPVSRRCRTGH